MYGWWRIHGWISLAWHNSGTKTGEVQAEPKYHNTSKVAGNMTQAHVVAEAIRAKAKPSGPKVGGPKVGTDRMKPHPTPP